MGTDRLSYLVKRVRFKAMDLEGETRTLAALLRHRLDLDSTQQKLSVVTSEARAVQREAGRLLDALMGFVR